MKAFSVTLGNTFLVAEFATPQSMLSWSLTRPGFVTSRKVAWLQVRDADLALGVDPIELMEAKMQAAGHGNAVHLMTSRDVTMHEIEVAQSAGVTSSCLATVGLSNASRIGDEPGAMYAAGTINLLAHVDRPLSQAAMIEALSLAAEARTAAIIDLDLRLHGRVVTGTGTDCIVVAAPGGGDGERYAGLHTDIGAALGRAVYRAVKRGGDAWMAERQAAATDLAGVTNGQRSLPAMTVALPDRT